MPRWEDPIAVGLTLMDGGQREINLGDQKTILLSAGLHNARHQWSYLMREPAHSNTDMLADVPLGAQWRNISFGDNNHI